MRLGDIKWYIYKCSKPGHTPSEEERYREELRKRMEGKSRFHVYKFCRRAGLMPWCSLRYALMAR